MKKGRHRRFEEARALKHTSDGLDEILEGRGDEPCPECESLPGDPHASWCLYEEAEEEDDAWAN